MSAADEQFRAPIEAFPYPMYLFAARRDGAGAVVDLVCRAVNAAGERLVGLPRDELVGHGLLERFPGVRRTVLWTKALVVLETGEADRLEMPFFEGEIQGFFDFSGSKFGDGLIVTAFDVTDRVRMADQLRHERSFYDATLDRAGVPLMVTDAKGRILRLNRNAASLTGYTEVEVLGRTFDFMVVPAERDEVLVTVAQVSAEHPISYVNHCLTKDGQTRVVRWSWVVLPDSDGRATYVVAGIDITDQQLIEKELERRADECEVANRELARSNEDLEHFAYVASHNLAEPLRAISGPVRVIAERYGGQLDDTAHQMLDFALDGCRQLDSMIRGLLEFSRVGRADGPPVTTDSGDAVRAATELLRTVLEPTGAEVITPDFLPPVMAEPNQLVQVFQNLISNAAKFVEPGVTPHISIAAQPHGAMWRFTVTDNGIGVDPRLRDRLFTMFRRLHAPDEYPGSGIGLAMVKKIVEHNGGEVGVEPAPDGPGSCFWFTLPSAEGSAG